METIQNLHFYKESQKHETFESPQVYKKKFDAYWVVKNALTSAHFIYKGV